MTGEPGSGGGVRKGRVGDEPLRVAVSIDTEEDNWQPAREGVRVENVRELPGCQRFLAGLGLRPTWFVDHAVASAAHGAAVLGELHAGGGCEIGAHLHPWNTPPVDEDFTPANTMLCNLPLALQHAKLTRLIEALTAATGAAPVAFRAGRFGLGPELLPGLLDAGFRLDSSVVPFVDWRGDAGPDFRSVPLHPYWLDRDADDLSRPGAPGGLREIPLSCGFTRRPFSWRSRIHHALRRGALARLPLGALASRTGLARRVILSPETDELEDLCSLTRRLVEEGARVVQLFFHSPSLVPGLSPFVADAAARQRFDRRIAGWLEDLDRRYSWEPATLSEAGEALLPAPARAAR